MGYRGVDRDITERKKAEEELAREHNLLRTLVDTLPDEIFVKDTNSTFVFNNLGCARNLGAKTPEEMVGKTDFDFLPREFSEIWYTEEQEIIRTGRPMINREECIHEESGRPVKCSEDCQQASRLTFRIPGKSFAASI